MNTMDSNVKVDQLFVLLITNDITRVVKINPKVALLPAADPQAFKWTLVHKGNRIEFEILYQFNLNASNGQFLGNVTVNIIDIEPCNSSRKPKLPSHFKAVGYNVTAHHSNIDLRQKV